MPQQKYEVTLPDGKTYEIELPDAQPSKGVAGQVGDFVREGANALVVEPIKMAKELGLAAKDVAGHLLAGGERRSAALSGGLQGAREGPGQLLESIKSGDALKSAVGADDIGRELSAGGRTGRVVGSLGRLVTGGMAYNAAKQGIKTGLKEGTKAGFKTAGKSLVPKFVSSGADSTVIADKIAEKSALKSALAQTRTRMGAGERALPEQIAAQARLASAQQSIPAPVPSPSVSPGFQASTNMGVPKGPIIGLTAPPRAASPVAASAVPTGRPGHFSLPVVPNAEARLAAAQKAGIGPQPVPESVHLESAARLAERRAKQGVSPTGVERRGVESFAAAVDKPVPQAAQAAKATPAAAKTPSKAKKGPKVPLVGMAKQTAKGAGSATMTPFEMRKMYGSEEAAKRMGMSQAEFLKLVDPGDMIPSRTPMVVDEAVDNAKYRNAIDPDSPYLYSGIDPRALWEFAKRNPKTAGAATGAAIGAASSGEGDDPLGRAGIGAGIGAGVTALPAVGRALLKFRREGALSGAAIPMNFATAVGAPITAAVEGLSTKSRMAPIKELFNLKQNLAEYKKSRTMGVPSKESGYVSGKPSTNPLAPTRIVRGIDATAQGLLRRGGVPEEEIERLILSGRNLSAETLAANPITREGLMFIRTPFNVLTEGMNEVRGMLTGQQAVSPGIGAASPLRKTTGTQRALTAGYVGAGAGIGEWVKRDPKKRGFWGKIALAMMGPRALPGLVGAMGGQALQGKAGRMPLGSASPIPEFVFDPNTYKPDRWFGMKPTLLKLLEDQGVIK